MYVLLLLPACVLLVIASIAFASFRKWKVVVGLAVIVLLINNYCKIVPFRLWSADEEGSFKVLTYNIRSTDMNFEKNADAMADAIINEKPLFIFLTEYYGTSSDILQNRLNHYFAYSDNSRRWELNEGDAFYSQWKIDSIYHYNLTDNFLSIYRVQLSEQADTAVVFCCHLSSNFMCVANNKYKSTKEAYRRRAKETDTLYYAIQKEYHSVIVMGDMNDISGSYTLRRIESAGFADAWWKAGCGYGSTFHDGLLRLRLDHVLFDAERLELKSVKVIGDNEWSDHNAISASFDFMN